MYTDYISTHLREYVTRTTLEGLTPSVQKYLRYKKVGFCDLHFEDALKNNYRRLVKHYLDNGILKQSTTYFNNLDSIDFEKRVRIPRKGVSIPSIFEGGYYISPSIGTGDPDDTQSTEFLESVQPNVETPDPEDINHYTPNEHDESGPPRNIQVWEIAMQMAVRYASDAVCDLVRTTMQQQLDTNPYQYACVIAVHWAALAGRSKQLANLYEVAKSAHVPVWTAYACAQSPAFIDIMTRIMGYKKSKHGYDILVTERAVIMMCERHDVNIYHKLIQQTWIRVSSIIFGDDGPLTAKESLTIRAACAGFYEVIGMPWLNESFPPDVELDELPQAIQSMITNQAGLRGMKYIMSYPSGRSLADKLAAWYLEESDYEAALWIVKQGYPPSNINSKLLRIEYKAMVPSETRDQLQELMNLLGIKL